MSDDRLSFSDGDPFDVEAMRHFWDATLRRIKAYAESSETGCRTTVDPTRDSKSLIDAGDESTKLEGG